MVWQQAYADWRRQLRSRRGEPSALVRKLNEWYPGVANSRNECDPLCHHRADRFKASFQGEGHDARRTTGYDTARGRQAHTAGQARDPCTAPRMTCARGTFGRSHQSGGSAAAVRVAECVRGGGALVAASVQRAIGPDGVPGQLVTLLIRDRQASASCGVIATIVAPSSFSVPATCCKAYSSATQRQVLDSIVI